MSKSANYFRIGLFIIVGVLLLLGGLLIFGAGQFFKEKITFETYEKGTVQGIDIDSPVKFRGVQIGKVNWMGFSFNTYPQDKENNRDNYIIIRMEVDREIFPNMFDEDLKPILEQGVKNGLRVRIEPQGITGMNYLEINYVDDPKKYPTLDYAWTPQYYYIPSAPGELTDILDSMNKIMRDVEELNFKEIQGGLATLLQNLNKAVTDAELGKVSETLQALLAKLDQAITEAKLGEVSEDARELIAGVSKSNDELKKLLQNIEPKDVKAVISNLEDITRNLEKFSTSIKDKPSLLLYGKPPEAKATPAPRRR